MNIFLLPDLREKVQSITIAEGETGYSYEQIFSNYLDGNVEWIVVEDPYIKARYQVHNFVRFCELAVKKCCRKLQRLDLHTGKGEVWHNIIFVSLTAVFFFPCSPSLLLHIVIFHLLLAWTTTTTWWALLKSASAWCNIDSDLLTDTPWSTNKVNYVLKEGGKENTTHRFHTKRLTKRLSCLDVDTNQVLMGSVVLYIHINKPHNMYTLVMAIFFCVCACILFC